MTAVPIVDRAITIAELALAYLEHAESYYVKNGSPTRTLWLVKTAMQTLLDDAAIAQAPAASMGPRLVMQAAAELAQRVRDDGSARYTRGTINDVIGQIKLMATFGAQWELIDESTAQRVRLAPRLKKGRPPAPGAPIPREGRKVRCVDGQLVERTLAALPPMIAAMAQLQLATAMRPIEVCAMKPEQIFESEHQGVWEYRVGDEGWKLAHVEGEAERIVYLGPAAMMILRPFLSRAAREGRPYVFSPAASEADRMAERRAQRASPRWPSHDPELRAQRKTLRRGEKRARAPKDRYDACAYAAAIRRACDRLGVERWSPNQLRHTAATRIAKATSLNEARLMLGHADIATTTIYADADRERAIGVAAKLG